MTWDTQRSTRCGTTARLTTGSSKVGRLLGTSHLATPTMRITLGIAWVFPGAW